MSFLDTEAAAKKLTLKKSTLEAWRVRGGGPKFVRLGRAVRYRQEDIDAFVEAGVRESTSAGARP